MSTYNTSEYLENAKICYGKDRDLLPDKTPIGDLIKFDEKAKVGDSFRETVVLTEETGYTFSDSGDAVDINPSRAGVVKQTTVKPSESILPSLIPFSVISRTAGGGPKAFFDATRWIFKNNLRSHFNALEVVRLYGRSAKMLGRVAYFDGTYRGVSFTDGTGSLQKRDGSTITFTNGVNLAEKAILLEKGDFAPAIWVAKEGVKVNQVTAAGAVVASGSLKAVDPELGYLTVDFTPEVPSAVGEYRLCYDGMELQKEMRGMHSILTTTGDLFGIPTNKYSLWQSTVYDAKSAKPTMEIFQDAISLMVARGGSEEDVHVLVNPRVLSKLISEQNNLVRHQGGSNLQMYVNGSRTVEFYSVNGKMTFIAHRGVMEGDAFIVQADTWTRSGSTEASFKIPGMSDELIRELENKNAFSIKSYSDQYLFCYALSSQVFIKNLDFEAAA